MKQLVILLQLIYNYYCYIISIKKYLNFVNISKASLNYNLVLSCFKSHFCSNISTNVLSKFGLENILKLKQKYLNNNT